MSRALHLVGYASGSAGVASQTGQGPLVLQMSPYLSAFANEGNVYTWEDMIQPTEDSIGGGLEESIAKDDERLAQVISHLVIEKNFFVVIGGDHACAMGTWSGLYDAVKIKGDIGLIWIDAHMDSHTPETTLSGRIHGMPLACLLGYGYPSLTSILHQEPKVKPSHLCLIGVRSYESGELALLKRLGVRIFFMDEVKKRGIKAVMEEAYGIVTNGTVAFGLSIDLDGFDPEEVPGVEVPEKDGIKTAEFLTSLTLIQQDPRLAGIEIVEFDPTLDQDGKTEKLIVALLKEFSK